jgi:hypothetical protein
MVTHTYSGGRDQTAVIGHAPEDRNWKPGDRAHKPFICSGARIEAFVTVDAGTKRATHIGRRTWLMKHVHVGHDAYIGEDCEVAPGAVICGHAYIGKGVKIGVNASILPYRKVGDGARIGAGAVVTKDVPAYETWVGSPAQEVRHRIQESDIAWAAGLFEGEGSFSTHGSGDNDRRYLRVCLQMKDRDIVERFVEVVGFGTIYEVRPDPRTGTVMHQWQASTEESFRQLLRLFSPYLGPRRLARAAELLEAHGKLHREQEELYV